MENINFITIQEYATAHGVKPCAVRRKCLRGYVQGAVKIGRDWLIPSNAPYVDHRYKEDVNHDAYNDN